jgi:dihydroneopterin aldolase
VIFLAAFGYIELKDLELAVRIGSYSDDDVVPDAHILDLSLTIDPQLVMIDRDDMSLVFDYDPLIRQIDVLARAHHYETQERLMTRIAKTCAGYAQIQAIDISLRKRPVLAETGSLGVRLILDASDLVKFRQ